ncbi:MAG: adenosylmethionine decarboxylase [Actinomycetota bacterium]
MITAVPSAPTPAAGAAAAVHSDISEMCSYALDAWFDDTSVLTDEGALLSVMRDAAAAGHATVVGQTSAIFPNGAVTAVVLLAESHLCVHTWPEHGLASFDLLTCGTLNAELMVSHIREALRPVRSNTVHAVRDLR